MSEINKLQKYKLHLEKRYYKLIERYNDYRYIDESKSDIACYKALKILDKLNRIKYLENSLV